MANQEKGQLRAKILTPKLGWAMAAILLAVILFSGGMLAGRLQQLAIYQSRVEPLADINPCNP